MNNPKLITEIESRNDLVPLLLTNPGLIILKFGAEWCGPCKRIEEDIDDYFNKMPSTVQCGIIDVDNSFDLYACLKKKKIISTIPAILCYIKGNDTFVPDEILMSSDKNELKTFINKCKNHLQ
tara:strand:+ start:3121 stop:3489 length:369 start_codon:yes stop_codon:yes gene_type:complete